MNLPEAPIAHEGFFATQFFIDLSDLTLQTRSANVGSRGFVRFC